VTFKERRKREREAIQRFKAKLTAEKKEQMRERERERRSTPEYREYAREYKRKDRNTPEGKEKERNRSLKRKYGLTASQWDGLFVDQGSCCAICKSTEPGSIKGWHTDHCHATGKIRGILCPHCNKALGYFKDSVGYLQAASKYLKSQ
jgi:hypothetical protein